MKGSGEYAVGTILSVGAYARNPLENRILDLNLDITFLYGGSDWMDYKCAQKLSKEMKNASTKIEIVPEAGHQLFIENSDYFNNLIVSKLFN